MGNSFFKSINLLKLLIVLGIFGFFSYGCGGGGGDGGANPAIEGGPTQIATWYKDADGDGYSDGTTQKSETRPSSIYYKASELTSTSGDCNDNDSSIHPGAKEVCSDSKDNNCDGKTDENCSIISYYVSPAGYDGNDCLLPSTPCKTIQRAIDIAYGTESLPVTINVAAGTYNEHLVMDSYESLEGGWNSDFTQQWNFEDDGLEPDPAYETIIDGDANGTCITQLYVNGSNINELTIQNGLGVGGGIYFDSSHSAVANCMIKDNVGNNYSGGNYAAAGMYNHDSSPEVINCSFDHNSSSAVGEGTWSGFAVTNENSQAKFFKCSFTGARSATNFHASSNGILNVNSSPIISECTFQENLSPYVEGTIVNLYSSPLITNCRFIGNIVYSSSPAVMTNSHSAVFMANCEFIGNRISDSPGVVVVISNDSSDCTIFDCTFSGNRVVATNNHPGFAVMSNSNGAHTIVKNSIFWDNFYVKNLGVAPYSIGIVTDESSTLEVSHCDIDQDGFAGINANIRQDPMFVSSAWDDNGTPDDPLDDVWVGNGDYHLQQGSPCINSGDNTALPADSTDLDNDGDTTEPIPLDLDGNPRILDGVVNMGAYE